MTAWGTKIVPRSLSAAKVAVMANTIEKETRIFLKDYEELSWRRPNQSSSSKHRKHHTDKDKDKDKDKDNNKNSNSRI